jgi:membrane-bound lytic murein transglycosylase A
MASPLSTTPCTYADLPGWGADDHAAALHALRASAAVAMSRPDTSLDLAAVLAAALEGDDVAGARAFFEAHFTPHRISDMGRPGLLTGYYEPVLNASLTPAPGFSVPLYRRPPDLENVVAEAARGAAGVGLTHVRRTAAGTEPYATREAIDCGALQGQGLELAYLADPVDAFFLHVQGSGALRLSDGSTMRVTYDGKNGHPYTSVGRTMIEDGTFSTDALTLQTMGDYLRADPDRARPILWRNASYVFFRELQAAGPVGVLDTPLCTGRSLAVDNAFHALGTPIYVSSPAMTHVAPSGFHRLMVAHDVGSAITGPERGDIYFGSGDAALELAGVTKHPCSFYVLVPRVRP